MAHEFESGLNTGGQDIDVFISYSHKDKAWVKNFSNKLKQMLGDNLSRELIFFHDEHSIDRQSELNRELKTKVQSSKTLCVFVSKNYLESKYCNDELKYFKEMYSAEKIENLFVIWLISQKTVDGLAPVVKERFELYNIYSYKQIGYDFTFVPEGKETHDLLCRDGFDAAGAKEKTQYISQLRNLVDDKYKVISNYVVRMPKKITSSEVHYLLSPLLYLTDKDTWLEINEKLKNIPVKVLPDENMRNELDKVVKHHPNGMNAYLSVFKKIAKLKLNTTFLQPFCEDLSSPLFNSSEEFGELLKNHGKSGINVNRLMEGVSVPGFISNDIELEFYRQYFGESGKFFYFVSDKPDWLGGEKSEVISLDELACAKQDKSEQYYFAKYKNILVEYDNHDPKERKCFKDIQNALYELFDRQSIDYIRGLPRYPDLGSELETGNTHNKSETKEDRVDSWIRNKLSEAEYIIFAIASRSSNVVDATFKEYQEIFGTLSSTHRGSYLVWNTVPNDVDDFGRNNFKNFGKFELNNDITENENFPHFLADLIDTREKTLEA